MCWVLDADINLGGGTIKAVGRHATGFQGTLYGNKHVIKNGTVQYETWIGNTAEYACGLFHYINGGKVYDLTVDSSVKLTMNTNLAANDIICKMGGVAAVAQNSVVVNCQSKVNISVSQSGAATHTLAQIGGLYGNAIGNTSMYKCSYNGTIYYKTAATHWKFVNGSGTDVGGLIGADAASGTTKIDQCAVTGTISVENNGADVGGLVGLPKWYASNLHTEISNIVLNVKVKMLGPDGVNAKDCGLISGEDYAQSVVDNANSTFSISNIYILGDSKVYRGSSDTTGAVILSGMEDNGPTTEINGNCSNIVTGVGVTGTVYPAQWNAATTANNKVANGAAVVSSANSNPAISNNYTLTNAGGITSTLGNKY